MYVGPGCELLVSILCQKGGSFVSFGTAHIHSVRVKGGVGGEEISSQGLWINTALRRQSFVTLWCRGVFGLV